jgi:hypothetical protein
MPPFPLSPPEDQPSITLEYLGVEEMELELAIFDEFAKSSADHGVESLKGRMQYLSNYYTHWQFISAVASTVPLAVLVKATKDILVKWLDTTKRSITINLDGHRKIIVKDAAELSNVLGILDRSDFAKGATAAPPPRKPAAKSRRTKNPTSTDVGDIRGRVGE